jgi:hypothetical protein
LQRFDADTLQFLSEEEPPHTIVKKPPYESRDGRYLSCLIAMQKKKDADVQVLTDAADLNLVVSLWYTQWWRF